ncbi:hypothetical protein SAMN05421820_107217 [Pedobacter steynii]|uniref:Uncharacterized protein n=1 Tax=Pedobacter steynii TaxID=430522 RepID=A0A1H0AVS2_9SPHI|nr:hypothetical protein [Pedobacter steynii]NQX41247.1 hypothetical protein [Pedobacter steynii]SDN37474.1 hypothetical protein SAMN05421820_107217 [Pedobacter steynii]
MTIAVFNIALGVLSAVVVILPFTGKVYDDRYKWFKKLTVKGWIVIISFIATIGVSYIKDIYTDELKQKEDEANKKLDNKNKLEIINALARYNLEYDSNQKVIIKLVKDPPKNKTAITYGNYPELAVCNISLETNTADSLFFDISFCVGHSTAYDLNLKSHMIINEYNKPLYLVPKSSNNLLIKGAKLSPKLKLTNNEGLIGSISNKNKLTVYFLLSGSYKSLDGKYFEYQELCRFSLENNSWGIVVEPYRANLIKYLRQNKININ